MNRSGAPGGAPSALDFEEEFRALLRSLGDGASNEQCVECAGCRACQGSTFCRDSERLCRCHYCVRCSLCTDCSHCRFSRGLVACNHCIETETSVRCSYLVRCVSLTDCTYCFGCVGLSGKDFHLLNVPYDRSTYFEITARLSRELGISVGR
ncbi:MAG TPA: hypothetical protein VHE30_21965 [Polyangiaceae bacterium]|nr:hypothetical protein [Polyangiaceae bacterium]